MRAATVSFHLPCFIVVFGNMSALHCRNKSHTMEQSLSISRSLFHTFASLNNSYKCTCTQTYCLKFPAHVRVKLKNWMWISTCARPMNTECEPRPHCSFALRTQKTKSRRRLGWLFQGGKQMNWRPLVHTKHSKRYVYAGKHIVFGIMCMWTNVECRRWVGECPNII